MTFGEARQFRLVPKPFSVLSSVSSAPQWFQQNSPLSSRSPRLRGDPPLTAKSPSVRRPPGCLNHGDPESTERRHRQTSDPKMAHGSSVTSDGTRQFRLVSKSFSVFFSVSSAPLWFQQNSPLSSRPPPLRGDPSPNREVAKRAKDPRMPEPRRLREHRGNPLTGLAVWAGNSVAFHRPRHAKLAGKPFSVFSSASPAYRWFRRTQSAEATETRRAQRRHRVNQDQKTTPGSR